MRAQPEDELLVLGAHAPVGGGLNPRLEPADEVLEDQRAVLARDVGQ